ncbi:hypothetical protein [Actinoplanes siamensis]|uniref:Uncharacterized protein n=1 Tax=Actinoplanes siamensis TaxID=1223317 RepID=A0A919TJU5_9ACTN|nr:hypothetical protein [Actinoplanes siamensis]GIF04808.1 hypothetical protein Asi03nite_23460 [Actinoplanes siamensis]
MTLIDLDREPDERPVADRRGRAWPWVAAALVAGVVTGGLAVHGWQEHRTRNQVGLVVLADASDWIGDRVEPGGQGSVLLYGHVAIVNTGPNAFQVRGLGGVHLTAMGGLDRWIEPAGVLYTSFSVELPCAGTDLSALGMSVTVEPRDAARRDVPVSVDGHPWQRRFGKACDY